MLFGRSCEQSVLPQLSISEIANDPSTLHVTSPTPVQVYPQDMIRFAAGQFAREDSRNYDRVRVAAGELLANAIYHGNERDPSKLVRVYCLWRRYFYLAVCDDGPGFDINDPPFVAGRSGMPPEGGLGIEVTKQKTDVLYNDGAAVIGIFASKLETKRGWFAR